MIKILNLEKKKAVTEHVELLQALQGREFTEDIC